MINKLKEKQVFVFGSNIKGEHLGGAAKQAHENFGAKWGVGEGLTGQSYAFPTLDEKMEKVNEEEFNLSIIRLIDCANQHKDKEFLLTKIGCGIAGFKEEWVKEIFSTFKLPDNIITKYLYE